MKFTPATCIAVNLCSQFLAFYAWVCLCQFHFMASGYICGVDDNIVCTMFSIKWKNFCRFCHFVLYLTVKGDIFVVFVKR